MQIQNESPYSGKDSGKLPFAPVTLADKALVDRYMKPCGGHSCQHSFTALYSLGEKYASRLCERDGFLLVFRQGLSDDARRVYLAPIGQGDLQAAYEALLADAEAHGCKAVFQTITGEQADFLKAHFPGRFRCTELRDWAEYLYDTQSLRAMAGGKLSDKRYKLNKILRTYGERLSVRPITTETLPDILDFETRWLEENAETHDMDDLQQEERAIRLCLAHFEELGLSGIGVYLDGELAAFAYGVALDDECYDGLAAKATRSVKNLYTFLYWSIANRCAAPYPLFNWEEDVGVPGLRQMKTEYAPLRLLRKYRAEELETPSAEPELPMESALPITGGEELL